jgi:hypothetical protein
MLKFLNLCLPAAILLALIGCGGGDTDSLPQPAPKTFSVGGTVSGLSAAGLVLRLNGTEDLSLPAGSGSFVFAAALAQTASYVVTAAAQPGGQTCVVSSGSGAMAGAAVTSIAVTCTNNPAPAYMVGGMVTGLGGTGLVLRNNGGDDVVVAASGAFTFATALLASAAYSVTVAAQPGGQTCVVSNGSGVMGSVAVTSIAVTCTDNPAPAYMLGGTVTGLSGTGLVLRNNGADDLAIAAGGAFTFATALRTSTAYAVTMAVQPSGQTCVVFNGSGVMAGAAVTNIAVTCTNNPAPAYTVGGTVTGLSGTGLVLRNNGADDLVIAAGGAFTFATALRTSAAYSVTVAAQPGGQTCVVSNGSGVMGDANVTGISIACSPVLVPLLVDDFDRPDQQGLGTTPQGQVWRLTGQGYQLVAIQDGRYVGGLAGAINPDPNVSYAGFEMNGKPTRLGGRISFVPSGTGGPDAPVVALISSSDSVTWLGRMVHLIASRYGVGLTWWREYPNQNNPPAQCVGSTVFAAPLAIDGTSYPLYMTLRGDTVTVDKPDGTQLICTDPNFSQLAGTVGVWELAYNRNASYVPRWDKVEAFMQLGQ